MKARLVATVAGVAGFLLGHLFWLSLWDSFVAQVSPATFEAVRQADAFGTIAGIAAAALTLAPGILLYLAVTELIRRFWPERADATNA